MLAFLTACSRCGDSIPGNRQPGGTRHPKTDPCRRVEEATCCGTRLDTSGAASFAWDTHAYFDRVALSTTALLTLTTVNGQQAAIYLPAEETDLGVTGTIATNSISSVSDTAVDSAQYNLGQPPIPWSRSAPRSQQSSRAKHRGCDWRGHQQQGRPE